MKRSDRAAFIEEAGSLVSDIVRLFLTRPAKRTYTEGVAETPKTTTPEYHKVTAPEAIPPERAQKELDYRYECMLKHLGEAGGVLREAYERALDEGIGAGTAEKVMECLNAHSAAEPDLEKMLAIPEGKEIAERLLSGIRQFRAAAWKTNMPRGGGTKADIEAARLWNQIMFQEAYSAAIKYPGQECVREGM